MKVRFWGVRGSLPASAGSDQLRKKLLYALQLAQNKIFESPKMLEYWMDTELPFWVTHNYGTNTSCVQIEDLEEDFIFCDAGSGLRDFAVDYMNTDRSCKPATFHFFLSHLHWDHIQGLPFFTPADLEYNRIVVHGHHRETERIIRNQMASPCFPIDFNDLRAKVEFDIRSPGESFNLGGFRIMSIEQEHPGLSYGYRFEKAGKSIIYSTDAEHRVDLDSSDYPFIDFFKNADLLIFDGQYSFADAVSHKENWGHSSNIIGVELAARSHVKHLVIYHLEPMLSDEQLDIFFKNTKKYKELYGRVGPDLVSLAYEGMVINL